MAKPVLDSVFMDDNIAPPMGGRIRSLVDNVSGSGTGQTHYYVFKQIKEGKSFVYERVGGPFDTREEARQFEASYKDREFELPTNPTKTGNITKRIEEQGLPAASKGAVNQSKATELGNNAVTDADKHRDNRGYNKEALAAQQVMMQSIQQRARDLGTRMRQQSGVDIARTPEMLRSEHYARLADRLNNAGYFSPGVLGGNFRDGFSDSGSEIYQMPRIETEDQRQQDVNRQRWGAKAQYEELEKNVNADAAMRTLDTQGMQQITNLENLRTMQPMQLDQLIRTNSENLWSAWQQLPYEYAQALNTAAAGNMINAYKMLAWLKTIDGETNPMAMYQAARAFGLEIPSVWQLVTTLTSISSSDSLSKFAKFLSELGYDVM